jgi:hypothetical protein
MVPLRFQVSLNGRVLCTAGMDEMGVLMVTAESENWPGPDDETSNRGTPAGEENTVTVNGWTEDDEDWRWVREKIAPGDEILIRVLKSGKFDPPTEVTEDDGD